MSEWQPIETAPRSEAVLVLVKTEDNRRMPYAVAWWSDNAWTREGDDYNLVVEPTHWMPLPAPPNP